MSGARKTTEARSVKVAAKPVGSGKREPFRLAFDIGTIKHLGLQMYSTLPPVIGELVSNAWDANATQVEVTIPTGHFGDKSEIVVIDNGEGMSDDDVRNAYMKVGRDRRAEENRDRTGGGFNRPIMGRKGIGKFAGFGIATEVEVESVKDGVVSRWVMNYKELERAAANREIEFPALPPTGEVKKGTRVTLRKLTKFRTRSVNIDRVRRGLARRFSIIGTKHRFTVKVNGKTLTIAEMDLQRLLDSDAEGKKYLWRYDNVEVRKGSGWTVNGWIGALDRTAEKNDGVVRGVSIMARGKLVQEPFVFEATVGQQFALSYLVGELHAEFVDDVEDTVGTTRNSLVWDTEPNQALLEWGRAEINRIAREWAERRSDDNEAELAKNPLYLKFKKEAARTGNKRAVKIADRLIKEVVKRNPVIPVAEQQEVVQMCIDFLEFDAFWELAEEITQANVEDPGTLATLFRDWEIVEAREMARVTGGRIATIQKLDEFIKKNAREVPVLHDFLKEFPWVLDPRWTLVDDEVRFTKILRKQFPEPPETPESDRRIDFLCVRENQQLIVVEIKRPASRVSKKELDQIRDYVLFMRDFASTTTDPALRVNEIVGYLLCGDVVITGTVREMVKALEATQIYVRKYSDLLGMVQRAHREFLQKYDKLREAKEGSKA